MLQACSSDGIILLRARTMKWLVSLSRVMSILSSRLGRYLSRKALRDYRFAMSANSLKNVIEQCGGVVLIASPRGAIPGEKSSLAVKLQYVVATLLWHVFRIDVSPGFLFVCRPSVNPSEKTKPTHD